MKKNFIFILIVIFPAMFAAVFNFDFENYDVTVKNDYQIFEMDETLFNQVSGEPMLPIKPVYIIIPFGCDVSEINSTVKTQTLSGDYKIYPVQPQLPIDQTDNQDFYFSNIYRKDDWYPQKSFRKIGVQRKNGVDILILQLYPFQYNPHTKKILHNENIRLEIDFKHNPLLEEKQKRKLLNNEKLTELFSKNGFENYEALFTYFDKSENYKSSRTSLVSSDDPYDYIIITDSSLETEWDDLISQKESFGLNVNLYTTDDIFSNYSGYDNPDKIRNFIIDAYETWSGTEHPLMWVFIGGDSDVVTARSVKCYGYWSGSWHSATYYTDWYYAGLDGDWDNDGDRNFGEGDDSQKPDDFPSSWILGTNGEEADFFADVYVGRAFLENSAEIENWLNKTISYENLSSPNDYLRTITLVGQYLGYGAYGGTAQDEIALFFPDFDQTRLYQMNGTYSKSNVVSAINNGTNIVSHLGHSNSSKVFDMYDGDVDTLLTNTDYCLIVTQGCYTCKFYAQDCIGESFLEKEHGAFAFVGNTHYGFYSSYKDQGSSQIIEREFVDAMINEGKPSLGMALADSKSDLAALIGAVGSLRWVMLDNSLFGDPHISLHLDVKNVSAAQTADNEITVTFEDSPGSGSENPANYSVFERDDESSTIPVTSCDTNGNEIILSLSENLRAGIPYNLKIENVGGLLNPTVRAIEVLSNIVELSITVPTTWTPSESPYYIYEDLIIRSNLTIEAGTVLKFNANKGVVIYDDGWLKAIGTQEDTIKFIPYENERNENGEWTDITFYRDANHSECELEYCLIDYATNGIYFDSTSTATIKNSIIAHTSERGIYSYYANPVIENVVVAFTDGDSLNSGFYFEGSNPQIKNIVSYQNADYGMYAVAGSEINLINSIIYDNDGGSVFLDSSVVNISYSNIEDGYAGTGNIDSDTLFANPDEYDFSLLANSPCIDTGDPESERDPDGTRADMGAFYYPHLFDFVADKMFGYDSLAVTFTDLSECEVTNWSWDFENDGVYDSFSETPTHVFSEAGVYDVKMKIERSGWADSLIKENYIVIQESQLPPPSGVSIEIDGTDVILEWSAIDTSRIVFHRNNLYYLIYDSDSPYDDFNYLSTTQDTTLVIDGGIEKKEKHFYCVIGFVGDLESLRNFVRSNKTIKIVNKKQGAFNENTLFNMAPRRGIEPLLQE